MYVLGVTGVQPRMPTHVDLMDLQPPDYKLLVFCIRAHCFNDTRKCWLGTEEDKVAIKDVRKEATYASCLHLGTLSTYPAR
eukprot:1160212-Pelagomonas_calceolata.AAC.11